jgi:hypothetical protein
MVAYSKVDHATLVRNLNAVCKELGSVMNERNYCGFLTPPAALTYRHLEDDIPLALYNIAVALGWVDEQVDMEENEYYATKDADLFGGCLRFRASFKEWFLGLVADTLADLEEIAEKNQPAQLQYADLMQECMLALPNSTQAPQGAEPENRAKKIIDEFFDKSKTVKNIQSLADAASERKSDGKTYPISRVRVSSIYHGYGAGSAVRELVASVINEVVPCTWNDLKATKRRPPISK